MMGMIGTADQVTFMRLAGIGAWRIIREDSTVADQVRTALHDLSSDPSVGIIIIPEECARHIRDILEEFSRRKSTVPVIVEIPTSLDQKASDIKEFYQSYAKRLIGFSIEI